MICRIVSERESPTKACDKHKTKKKKKSDKEFCICIKDKFLGEILHVIFSSAMYCN